MLRVWPFVTMTILSTLSALFKMAPVYAHQHGRTFEEAIPAGRNFSIAEFRLWYPSMAGTLKGAVILVPGSNDDGRSLADDATWQAFALKHKLALVGCRFTDKAHDLPFIEEYAEASQGTGPALLKALELLAIRSNQPELAETPLLLWGFSAGGQFNYEFVAWRPERVIAFVVNKGGVYYSALLSRSARNVPGIFFLGTKDLKVRRDAITGLFAVNRRAGALWALAEEPGAAHIVGRSMEVAKIFFEDALALRLPAVSTVPKMIQFEAGFVGDPSTRAFRRAGPSDQFTYTTSWLPTFRVAQAWQAMLTEKPLGP